MSEILKAKQRLLMKSNSIAQTPQQDAQFKVFARTGNASSIPKLNMKQKQQRQRSIGQIQIQDEDLNFQHQFRRLSPKFAKTQRNHCNKPVQKFHPFPDKAQSINLFGSMNIYNKKKATNRRTTQYSQYGMQPMQQVDMSFTQNQRSVYNQSPIKTVRNTVHGDKLNIIITKPPLRKAVSPFKPKQCQIDYITQTVKQQKSKNAMYSDYMFPPKFTIIFNKKYMYLQQGLKLQRLTKIYEGTHQLRLIKYSEPTLMDPGKFTSPALYSALTILSEDPTRVLNVFGNQQFNTNGVYFTHICKDGVWRYIIVDDYLPVKILAKRSLLYLHSLPKNGFVQFWPAILQKSIAKIYGTYQDIYLTAHKGIKDIFRSLTGYPCSQYLINKDFRTYLIIIDAAIKKKQIVVLQNIALEYRQTAHVKGIQPGQSYQIIQVKKNYTVIRNIGDKDLITKLTFQEAMIFSRLLIFRSQNNYCYISKTLRHKSKCFSIIKVKIKSNIKCYWDVWQNNQVYYKNHIGSQADYQKSKYSIHIKKQQTLQQTYDSALQDQILTQSGKQVSMSPGNYDILIHLCQRKQQDFTLSFYGQQQIQMERSKNMERWPIQCEC